MLAILLVIALLLFWEFTGYVALWLFFRRNLIRNVLLAPAIGISLTLLPVFWINRLGVPIRQFGPLVFIILLVVSLILVWGFRPLFPLRHALPFLAVLLLALVLIGGPMLEFGFNWASYSNDDYANYVLNAERLNNHGWFTAPDADQIVHGKDYTQLYWFVYTTGGIRAGADMLLAWVLSLTSLNGVEAFMPVIVAFHISLIAAAGAFVCQSRRLRLAALLTCLLLSMSALITLGTLYQLFGQVPGMVLFCGAATVLFAPFRSVQRRGVTVRRVILLAVLVSALFIIYPELTPFLGLGFILYVGLGLLQRRWPVSWRPMILTYVSAGILTLIFLNSYILSYIYYVYIQINVGVGNTASILLFPYYLVPSGLANLWGLQRVGASVSEPLQSIYIALGLILLLVGLISTVIKTWRGQPVAFIAGVMLAVSLFFFYTRNGFPLYKLAMYAQPFLLGTLVIAWVDLIRRKNIRQNRWRLSAISVLPVIVLGVANLPAQRDYVNLSRGYSSGSLVEIPYVSSDHVAAQFNSLVTSTPSQAFLVDTPNVVLAKLQSLYVKGTDTSFISASYFANIVSTVPPTDRVLADEFQKLVPSIAPLYKTLPFNLHDNQDPSHINTFYTFRATPEPGTTADDATMLLTSPRLFLFNQSRLNWFGDRDFVAMPVKDVQDYLVFVDSLDGRNYYFRGTNVIAGQPAPAAFYQPEADYFYPGHSMIGVGRYILFEVVNPTQAVRLRLSVTRSLTGGGENNLPPAVVIGSDREAFPLVGSGSARVFSPPLSPQLIDGHYYIEIDMGAVPQYFNFTRDGLMKLYGQDVRLDSRVLVAFVRDISLVSNAEYTNLTPPAALKTFPQDLTNPGLEYSGVYEDGWLSDAAFVTLNQSGSADQFLLCGMVPEINNPNLVTQAQLLIDGKVVVTQDIQLGQFELRAPSTPPGKHQVDVRFSQSQQLPGNDGRSVSALLKFMGFQSAGTACP